MIKVIRNKWAGCKLQGCHQEDSNQSDIVTRRLRIANSREIEDTHHVGGHGSLAWQISGDESFQS